MFLRKVVVPQKKVLVPPKKVLVPPKKVFSSPKKGFSSRNKGFSSPKTGFSSPNKGLSSPNKGSSSPKKVLALKGGVRWVWAQRKNRVAPHRRPGVKVKGNTIMPPAQAGGHIGPICGFLDRQALVA